jgi:hypothetical protein
MTHISQLQIDIENAIKWEPLLKTVKIGVIVIGSIVTLIGVVDSFAKKMEAENTANKIAGIKSLVNKIEVKFSNPFYIEKGISIEPDEMVAWQWNWDSMPIHAKVRKRWVKSDSKVL